jgi:hypothetical protein
VQSYLLSAVDARRHQIAALDDPPEFSRMCVERVAATTSPQLRLLSGNGLFRSQRRALEG